MAHFPRSLIEFQRRFPDESACAAHLAQARWPNGFRCLSIGVEMLTGIGVQMLTTPQVEEVAACPGST
jgi:hypothetical protein